MLHQAVELLLGVLVLVLLPAHSYTHLPWHVPNSSAPQETIQASVDPHILKWSRDGCYLGEHFLLGELPDFPDGSGSSPLELDGVQTLMEVDRVVSGDWLQLFLLGVLGSRHFLN